MTTYRRIALAARPEGPPTVRNFRLEDAMLPDPQEGEVAVRTIWMSLDPYMRGRMDDARSYAPPVEIGATMEAGGVGEVTASRHPDFAPGDVVVGRFGWAERAVLPGSGLNKVPDPSLPLSTALGVLGMPGHTAWTGINDILGIEAGETVVISAATGAVGSVAGQLARLRGARVIGVAGGPEKCRHATEDLGFDACLDHRAADAADLRGQIEALAPDGVHGYFENVGGKTLEAVLPNMREGGRIAVCGMIAWYSGKGIADAMPLPAAWRLILTRRLRVQGFLIFDHAHRFGAFHDEVAPLVREGRILFRESVAEGLEAAPEAFLGLLEGRNFGKQVVRVGPDP